ncbi:MAG TPA: adenylate/guanylate cyclase domain-containing protein [Bradyrhizobium sp.]|jgi:adenylate cyclase|nr:adenylate/guanylate cyclase domain-containing protein [Bradyrhizobium sp.]
MKGIQPVLDWLIDGARSDGRSEEVLAALCQRLVACGMPLSRVAVFVTTLHPDVMGRRFVWRAESGVTTSEALFDQVETDDFRESPFATVYNTRKAIRYRLTAGEYPDIPVLRDMAADGATDYVAYPLLFSDGTIHVATWATGQPSGFTPEQLAGLESVLAPLARVAEIRALRRTASNVIETYVGNQTGERILAGKIRRGYVETIRAAIWLSDMRSFTTLAERLPPQALVDLLNQYFDCQVPAIIDRGGEILKFMGDGLLAIFPLSDGGKPREVCSRALDSAREARARLDDLNARRPEAPIRFGLALHLGQVMYGNIGGGNRLDFTCVGPAVNLAARLEKVAAKLGRTVVASAEFSAQLPNAFEPLGDYPVAGFVAAQAVFGLSEEANRSEGDAPRDIEGGHGELS